VELLGCRTRGAGPQLCRLQKSRNDSLDQFDRDLKIKLRSQGWRV
jgi:hypothetical protein